MSDPSNESTAAAQSDPASLEERKFQLERDKFEFEKSKSRFFNSNIGLVITAIIGTATIVVSYLQLLNNHEFSVYQQNLQKQISDNQLELQRKTSEAQQRLEELKARAAQEKDERTFQFDVARLMLERQSDINTEELKRVYYLREIVLSALPNSVGMKVARRAADNASDDRVRSAWLDGLVMLALNETQSSANMPSRPISADDVLARFPLLAKLADGKGRIIDILDAAREFGLEDAAPIILAYALFASDFFRKIEEDFNFASAERIVAVFPNTFPSPSDAKPFVEDRRALANRVYSGRLGNDKPDDGWSYRGRGYLRTTGKAAYARSRDLIGTNLIADPGKLADSKVAAREIAATFANLGRPITVVSVVRQLNGRLLGLAGIQAIYEKLVLGASRMTEGLTIPASR